MLLLNRIPPKMNHVLYAIKFYAFKTLFDEIICCTNMGNVSFGFMSIISRF